MPYKNRDDALKKRQSYRDRNRKFIKDYLKTHPCSICGFDDTRALEFDHVDVRNKKRNISDMISGTPSIETIKREIEKCQVLCANCHRIKTIERKDYLHKKNRHRLERRKVGTD